MNELQGVPGAQLRLADRFHPRLRREQQAAIDAGRLEIVEELELLAPEQLAPLTRLSLVMLLIGAVFFIVLNASVYLAETHRMSGSVGGWPLLLWIVINILLSIVVLPVHEAIHGLAFLLWGGHPHFGAKLPFALYCGARKQLFRRNEYLVVGLAPVVVLTVAAIIFTFISPLLASYTLLASLANFSGAAGDVWVARRIARLFPDVLIEDTETGYRVWKVFN